MTRRKDKGLTGNGGQFAKKAATAGSGVDIDALLSKRDRQTLQDLLEFAETASRLVARGRKDYDDDEMLQIAAESIVHRLGEAVSRLSEEVTLANQQVQWRGMKGMRNVVAHEYGAIDYHLVWNSLAEHLPKDAAELRRILDN